MSDNYQNILSNVKQSVCHMYLFVNLKGTYTIKFTKFKYLSVGRTRL